MRSEIRRVLLKSVELTAMSLLYEDLSFLRQMGRKLDGNSVKVDLMPSFPAVFKPSNVTPEDDEEESDEEHAQDEDEQDVDEQDGDEQEGDVDEDDVEVGGIVNPVNVVRPVQKG